MTHTDIWDAIETLALIQRTSVSKLAETSGLDPTTFNKSKRTQNGRPRWPSFGTVARVLQATGTSWTEFVGLIPHNNEHPNPGDFLD